jgi:iron complex transport system permease protein
VVPSALLGAALLGAGDLAGQRVFAPSQLPAGVTTGVLGGLYLAWLLARSYQRDPA